MISRSPPPSTAGYGLLQEFHIFIVNERAYKVAALAVRALKITSMLAAYQAEVYVRPMRLGLTNVWEEITVITDIYLCIQRCTIQATFQDCSGFHKA